MITLSPADHEKAQGMRNFSGWIARRLNESNEGPQAPMKSWAQLLNMIGEHYGFESKEYNDFMLLRPILSQLVPDYENRS
tara:strand:- start:242 stop:481 length:240 start_codon:yes stop_codon:yes gene_type:complete